MALKLKLVTYHEYRETHRHFKNVPLGQLKQVEQSVGVVFEVSPLTVRHVVAGTGVFSQVAAADIN